MITRLATLALVSLVLLHQTLAGVFGGGTVLCVGGANGLAVQPVGMKKDLTANLNITTKTLRISVILKIGEPIFEVAFPCVLWQLANRPRDNHLRPPGQPVVKLVGE